MGIDIRDGQQMECITCALCIDACDDVMGKIGKPRGLIDYLSLSDEPMERAGAAPRPIWRHILRPRTVLYSGLWAGFGALLVYGLFIRSDVELTVSPIRNPVYVTQSDGSIRNIYDVRLRNKIGQDREFHLSLTSEEVLRISLEGRGELQSLVVTADSTILQRGLYHRAPGGPGGFCGPDRIADLGRASRQQRPGKPGYSFSWEGKMITQIKGWHVALAFGLAFGLIIAVNLTLAFNAIRTFPGLEVKNSYVASQSFDRDRQAQTALDWQVSARFRRTRVGFDYSAPRRAHRASGLRRRFLVAPPRCIAINLWRLSSMGRGCGRLWSRGQAIGT